jgi:hypothetical protein
LGNKAHDVVASMCDPARAVEQSTLYGRSARNVIPSANATPNMSPNGDSVRD